MRWVLLWLLLLGPRLAQATDCSSFPNFCDPSATCSTLSPSGLVQCEPCYCPWDTDSYIPNNVRLNDFLLWQKTWTHAVSFNGISASADDWEVLAVGWPVTLVQVACRCDLNCGTPATLSFTARKTSPAAIDISGGGDLTCTTGTGAMTFTNFDTGDSDRILAKGEGVRITTTNSPTADQRVTIIFTGTSQ